MAVCAARRPRAPAPSGGLCTARARPDPAAREGREQLGAPQPGTAALEPRPVHKVTAGGAAAAPAVPVPWSRGSPRPGTPGTPRAAGEVPGDWAGPAGTGSAASAVTRGPRGRGLPEPRPAAIVNRGAT